MNGAPPPPLREEASRSLPGTDAPGTPRPVNAAGASPLGLSGA